MAETSVALHFQIQRQLMPNWCWAAVATSVFKFYRPTSLITQNKLVADILRIPVCNSTFHPACNQMAGLSETLHWLNVYNGRTEFPVEASRVAEELAMNKPVCCLLMHPRYSGHFVVISALFQDPSNPHMLSLRVEDPLDGLERIVPYPTLINGFRNSYWVKTYFTKPLGIQ